MCVWKLSPSSTQYTPLHSSAISFFVKSCQQFRYILQNSAEIRLAKCLKCSQFWEQNMKHIILEQCSRPTGLSRDALFVHQYSTMWNKLNWSASSVYKHERTSWIRITSWIALKTRHWDELNTLKNTSDSTFVHLEVWKSSWRILPILGVKAFFYRTVLES